MLTASYKIQLLSLQCLFSGNKWFISEHLLGVTEADLEEKSTQLHGHTETVPLSNIKEQFLLGENQRSVHFNNGDDIRSYALSIWSRAASSISACHHNTTSQGSLLLKTALFFFFFPFSKDL